MLNTIAVVAVEKGKYSGTYSRPYFTFPEGHPVVEEEQIVEFEKEQKKYKVTSPDKAKAVTATDQHLFKEALAYFDSIKDEGESPLGLLLKAAERGEQGRLSLKAGAALKPGLVDADRSAMLFAKSLVQTGQYKNIDDALKAVKVLMAGAPKSE